MKAYEFEPVTVVCDDCGQALAETYGTPYMEGTVVIRPELVRTHDCPDLRDILASLASPLADRGAILEALCERSYTPGRYDSMGGDGYVPGEFDLVEDALVRGLLTNQEYEQVARRAIVARPACNFCGRGARWLATKGCPMRDEEQGYGPGWDCGDDYDPDEANPSGRGRPGECGT